MSNVFICRKCGRTHSHKEFRQSRFCKSCGTFLRAEVSSNQTGEFVKLDSRKSMLHYVKCGGCQELAVRYCNCHFECIFCFAINYAWPSRWKYAKPIEKCSPKEIVESVKQELGRNYCDWVRITGGEPLLNEKRTHEMIETLLLLDKSIDKHLRIIIQTNGFALSNNKIQMELTKLFKAKNLRILIELSFKGTNSREFSLLTQRKPALYFHQINAYHVLHRIMSKNNVAVRARMGIGPHSKSIIFIYPDTFPENNYRKNIETMFHPSKWCEEFKEVHQNELGLYGYVAIEDINVTEGGINARTQLNMPAVVRLLERKLVLDRSNRINEYSDFSRMTAKRFPILSYSQRQQLEKKHLEIRSKFNIIPAQAYFGKNEFPI